MNKYIIIEDERLAYEELKRMIHQLRPDYTLCGWATSVEQAVVMLRSTEADLLFVDISLADGDSFDIFEQVDCPSPIIFTTAYDEFALKAFKTNSVDYLLKPIDPDELAHAIEKYERQNALVISGTVYRKLRNDMMSGNVKTRFLVQYGDIYEYVDTHDVAYFLSEDKYTFLYTLGGRHHIVNYSLDALEQMLDNTQFFRTSRKLIVNIKSIKRMTKYFTGRIKLSLEPEPPTETIVSRSRAASFLDWVNGNP